MTSEIRIGIHQLIRIYPYDATVYYKNLAETELETLIQLVPSSSSDFQYSWIY